MEPVEGMRPVFPARLIAAHALKITIVVPYQRCLVVWEMSLATIVYAKKIPVVAPWPGTLPVFPRSSPTVAHRAVVPRAVPHVEMPSVNWERPVRLVPGIAVTAAGAKQDHAAKSN